MTTSLSDEDDPSKQLSTAVRNELIPKLYANGFTNALSNGDVILLLLQNGQNVATLNLSYTIAKTLAVKLAETIASLEAVTGSTIMTVEQISGKLHEIPERSATKT